MSAKHDKRRLILLNVLQHNGIRHQNELRVKGTTSANLKLQICTSIAKGANPMLQAYRRRRSFEVHMQNNNLTAEITQESQGKALSHRCLIQYRISRDLKNLSIKSPQNQPKLRPTNSMLPSLHTYYSQEPFNLKGSICPANF